MPPVWAGLWSMLLFLDFHCAANLCRIHGSSSSANISQVLDSLQCHNDYKSYVQCTWRKDRDAPMQLWFKSGNNREECVLYPAPDGDDHDFSQCRYQTHTFAIGLTHTVFFLNKEIHSACSSVLHTPLSPSHYLKAHIPVDLSSHDPGDGGRLLKWSSPYSSSSALSKNLSYQLSYRSVRRDDWTTEAVSNTTSIKLPRQLLRPGHGYEARVRLKVSVGQWSDWSPVVTWKNKEDPGQLPSLHCVLVTEKEVKCSWEVSRKQATFITYQLVCQHNRTAPPERCCLSPTVTPDRSASVKYSCSLSARDPAQLLLELQPTHTAKTFKAHQHIRPEPPRQVKVREKNNNWIVEWTEPSTASNFRLFYQVCYHSSKQQECSSLVNISAGSTFLIVLTDSLTPSQVYKVKVRSLVLPGSGSKYEGPPSEWSDAAEWTSHAATWSLSTMLSVLITVLMTTAFFTFFTVPLCKRRIILWVDSVPSPGKSKILSEIQASTGHILQSENVSLTKGLAFDTMFSHSTSDCSLWTPVSMEKRSTEPDEGFWSHESSPTPPEKGSQSDQWKSVDVKCKEEDDKTHLDHSMCPGNLVPNTGVYVFLPNPVKSMSTQDLVSTSTNMHHPAEQEQNCPDEADHISQPTHREQPLDYTAGPFTSWPHGGTLQPSGYCHLPQPT